MQSNEFSASIANASGRYQNTLLIKLWFEAMLYDKVY